MLLPPGVNVYGARNARLALNADVFLPSDDRDALFAFRSQVQIVF